jgi:hypothetical protein
MAKLPTILTYFHKHQEVLTKTCKTGMATGLQWSHKEQDSESVI